MKFFWLFFSFYVLFLSVLPCSDRVECADHARMENSQNTDHQNHKHETELCSPFCTCACCGVTIVYVPNISLPLKNSIEQQYIPLISLYTFHYASADYGSIWQPPKSLA